MKESDYIKVSDLCHLKTAREALLKVHNNTPTLSRAFRELGRCIERLEKDVNLNIEVEE